MQGGIQKYHEIGRAVATVMSDEVFHDVAYKAKKRDHLLAGLDEFLDAVTVLPPGEWDPSIRIEPPNTVPSQEGRKHPSEAPKHIDEEEEEQRMREEAGLTRTGRLFGGLINDIKRKKPWYLTDFKDAISMQCVASYVFIYFACLTPIITFGGLLGDATKNNIASMESLVSGLIVGTLYGMFSAQPLTKVSTHSAPKLQQVVFDHRIKHSKTFFEIVDIGIADIEFRGPACREIADLPNRIEILEGLVGAVFVAVCDITVEVTFELVVL